MSVYKNATAMAMASLSLVAGAAMSGGAVAAAMNGRACGEEPSD